jgi:hypothetical protein
MITGRWGTVFWRDFRLCPDVRQSGFDVVALDLDVKSLVVHSKQPGRLARVSSRDQEGEPDRLALRLGDGPIDDLLQRRALLSRLRVTLASKYHARNSRARNPSSFDRLRMSVCALTRESRRP